MASHHSLAGLVDKKKYVEVEDDSVHFSPKYGPGKGFKLHGVGSASILPPIHISSMMSARSVVNTHSQLDEYIMSNHSMSKRLLNAKTSETDADIQMMDRMLSKLEYVSKQDDIDLDQEIEVEQPVKKDINADELRLLRAPIRKVLPNSSINLVCIKGEPQFYKISFEGYKFPLTISYNKKVIVDTYLSYKYLRPNNIKNDFEYSTSTFQITRPPVDSEIADQVTKPGDPVYLFMCISPHCDFKTMMTVTFESKEFRIVEQPIEGPRTFSINYKEFSTFSDQFISNLHSLKALNKNNSLAAIEMNKELLKNYSAQKENKLKRFRELDSQRKSEAKIKVRAFAQHKLESIHERKAERERGIILKRMTMEAVLEKLVQIGAQRTWIYHIAVFRVIDQIKKAVDKRNQERDFAMKKFYASNLIIKQFHKFMDIKNKLDDNKLLITKSVGKETQSIFISKKDVEASLATMQIYIKLVKSNCLARSISTVGTFCKLASIPLTVNGHIQDFRRRVINFQKACINMKNYKASCLNIYTKLFSQIIEEIQLKGEEHNLPMLKIQDKLSKEDILSIVTYLFDYYLHRDMVNKYKNTKMPSKDFPLIYSKLNKNVLEKDAKYSYDNKYQASIDHPHTCDVSRLKKLKEENSINEQAVMVSRTNKKREEIIEKLKIVFMQLMKKFQVSKFVFDFDDLNIKLFLLSYFNLTKLGQQYEDVVLAPLESYRLSKSEEPRSPRTQLNDLGGVTPSQLKNKSETDAKFPSPTESPSAGKRPAPSKSNSLMPK